MTYQTCMKCGKILPEGSLKYIVSINILADFEGILLESFEDIDGEIENIIEELREMDPVVMERDIQQKIAFHLCKNCKDQFASDPLSTGEEASSPQDKTQGMLH